MRIFFTLYTALLCITVYPLTVLAQAPSADTAATAISLNDLSAFRSPSANWHITGGIAYDLDNENAKEENGTGILINTLSGDVHAPLITNMAHKNIILSFDFMLSPLSSSAVYLQGRYGIRLNDSWTKDRPLSLACGAIVKPLKEQAPDGLPPRFNVCRAPGLWQHVRIVFRSPEYDSTAKKIADARFVQISLNGIAVHEDIVLPQTIFYETFRQEGPSGPLLFAGDGKIAIRNIRYTTFNNNDKDEQLITPPAPAGNTEAQIVTPGQKVVVQRCFMVHEGKKKTSCAVVGEPAQIHYAIDLEQGSFLYVWKGMFIDATAMWYERGIQQTAQPLGSVIALPSGPAFAILKDKDAAWPDSMQHDYQFMGYSLDEQGHPTFNYSFNGAVIADKTITENNNRLLIKKLVLNKGMLPEGSWFRLATGVHITQLEKDLYTIDDKSYYIRLKTEKKLAPVIRKINGKEELLISGDQLDSQGSLSWSVIW